MDRLEYALTNLEKRQNYIRMNVSFHGRRTSIGLEREVLDMLTELCETEGLSLNEVCARIASTTDRSKLSRRLRVLALTYSRMYGSAAARDVHRDTHDANDLKSARPATARRPSLTSRAA